MSKKDKMIKALNENLPANKQPPEIKLQAHAENIVHDTETDVQFARDTLKDLINKSTDALEHLSVIAQETEHPRAFEVLSNMIKSTGDLTTELIDVQKKRKDITQEKGAIEQSGNTTNNAIFVGSTQELQKILRNREVIDADDE
jgi:hypothetical protein